MDVPKSGGEIELGEGASGTSRGCRDEDNRRGGRYACGEWIREEKYRLDPETFVVPSGS